MAQTDFEATLAGVPLLAKLSKGERRKLAALCIPRSFEPGRQILEEGGTGLGLFVILSGRVEVYKTEPARRVTIAYLSAGEVLGEMALIDDQPRSASAVALERTECILLTRESFRSLLRDRPAIAWSIVPALAERLRELQERLLEPSSESAGAPPAPTPAVQRNPPDADARIGLRLARLQTALIDAALTAARGSVGLAEGSWARLRQELDLEGAASLAIAFRRLPAGLVSAASEALRRGERLPEEVLASFLAARRRGEG